MPLSKLLPSIVFLTATLSFGATCPDNSRGETAADCPWASITRELSQTATENRNLEALFQTLAPRIAHELHTDANLHEMLGLWGRSVNFDELAHATIVEPAILRTIVRAAQGPWISDLIAHAGIEHTYGYLFSNLKTPFGYKRARWIQGEIEAGFGLHKGVLGPEGGDGNSARGTLLSNATFFAGSIAFRGEPSLLAKLQRWKQRVAPSIRDFNYATLSSRIIRIEEWIVIPEPARTVILRTDLVTFTSAASLPDSRLLVYSVDDSTENGPRLVTLFPIAESFAQKLLRPEGFGEHQPIQAQYNAYVSDVTGRAFMGARVRTNAR